MIYMRGQARDYDQWAQLTGDDDWRWDRCLPDFMAHEDHHRLDLQNRPATPRLPPCTATKTAGSTGEWRIEKQRLRWDLLDALPRPPSKPAYPPAPTSTPATTRAWATLR
jgi:choline dehydrogenase